MKRTEEQLDAKQILSVIEKYSLALDLLDAYDHQNMKRPEGGNTIYILSYQECRKVIDSMAMENPVMVSVMRRMILLREVLGRFTRPLQARKFIRLWKKKQQICYTLLQKIILFRMGIKGLLLLFSYILWIEIRRCFWMVKR